MTTKRSFHCLFLVLVLAAVASPAASAARGVIQPVPSLEPAATQALWQRLVHERRPYSTLAAAQCRPLRAVFYAETDWLRLATHLAQNQSPCAQYYISVPGLAADHTQLRPNQAPKIRALGPNFHAVAEINYTAWSRWVASTGHSWYDAGVEARRRMAATGFDVNLGDTWAMNEISSAVRRGDGSARTAARDLIRGLFTGDGTGPTVKGVVFTVGIGQSTPDLFPYKLALQGWLQDLGFWQDMTAYVSDWSQELYGDIRRYAVADAPPQTRRDYLNDFLQHELLLANAGPDQAATARSFIQATYSPLANAAWPWESNFGYTAVPIEQMEDYVSAQTYALRSFDSVSGLPQDHFGFAWSPRVTGDLSHADFVAQTDQLLDRLAVAVRDSGEINAADPGIGACGPSAQWCSTVVSGALFSPAWKTFASWTFPQLGFATAPVTMVAGTTSPAITVFLQADQIPQNATAPVVVTLTSSSPTGLFSTSPTGPFTSSIQVTIQPGTASANFYYQDTTAGSPVISAASPGLQTFQQAETITAGQLTSLSITPPSATVIAPATATFTTSGVDTFGNTAPVPATWTLTPPELGTLSPESGTSTLFTPIPGAVGTGQVTATVSTPAGPITATATVTITQPKLRASSIRYGTRKKRLVVTVAVVDGSTRKAIPGASVSLTVFRGSSKFASSTARTRTTGKLTLMFNRKVVPGCYRTTLRRVAAVGHAWDHRTPVNRFCSKAPKPKPKR
jgi:hypothetical protein